MAVCVLVRAVLFGAVAVCDLCVRLGASAAAGISTQDVQLISMKIKFLASQPIHGARVYIVHVDK